MAPLPPPRSSPTILCEPGWRTAQSVPSRSGEGSSPSTATGQAIGHLRDANPCRAEEIAVQMCRVPGSNRDLQIFSLALSQVKYCGSMHKSIIHSLEFGSPFASPPKKGSRAEQIPNYETGSIGRSGGRAARQGSKAGQQATFIHCCVCCSGYSRLPCLSCKTMFQANNSMHYIMYCARAQDSVSERLRRWTQNPLGSARRGLESLRSQGNCFAVWSCLSPPLHEHIHNILEYHRDRQTDTQVWRAEIGSPVSSLKSKWVRGQTYPTL